MSEHPRRIYLLDPQRLSPETIAVTFAKTSRSPASFDEIAAELSDEKSARFNEKWVVGYGHASVAEHAVLHIAIENVSRLAVETIEGNRLASFTEKSTRYQRWDSAAYYSPPELEGNPLLEEYRAVVTRLFDCYLTWQPLLINQLKRECPRRDGEDEGAYEHRLRAATLDVVRYLLPAASLANLGMTVNARELEHALCKMLSSPLEEVRQIGTTIQQVAASSVPTLVKYVTNNECIAYDILNEVITREIPASIGISDPEWLRLVASDEHGLDKILASLLYSKGGRDYATCLQRVSVLPPAEKETLLQRSLANLGPHDRLPREFEHTSCTFDLLVDQGAYYEIKRHRMMTQSPQALGASLGFTIPSLYSRAGLAKQYRDIMQAARDCYCKLAVWNPDVAAYIVPNGFNRRLLMSLNMREAHQFIRLRSSPKAHFAVRRVARRMAEEIMRAHPLLASLFQATTGETWQSIEQDHFQELLA